MKQTLAQWISVSLISGSLFFSVPTVQASTFDLSTPASWALNWATFQNMLAHPANQNHSPALMRMGLIGNLDRIGDISNFPVQFDWMADLIPALDLLLSIPTATEGGSEQLQVGLETHPTGSRSLFPLSGLQNFWSDGAMRTSVAESDMNFLDDLNTGGLDEEAWTLQLRKPIGHPLLSRAGFDQFLVREFLTGVRQSVGQ